MKLEAYKVSVNSAEIVPGSLERDWMNAFADRHPYRCLPLVIANTTGWALLCPVGFSATWNGGMGIGDLTVCSDDGDCLALSHFGGGVLTFHPGWLFRTDPGWDLWCSGAPNEIKDGIQPLVGITETYWLPFTFTMNWRFTRPGTIRFEKGEPFCFIMPVPHSAIDEVDPVTFSIHDDPELREAYMTWRESRADFNAKLQGADPVTTKQGWQRTYHRGRTAQGREAPADHINRRRLPDFRPGKE